MSKQIEAMKLALARLQARTDTADLDAIAALNEALAEQPAQQEPLTDIYRSFEQWKNGNVLEHGMPRTEYYSEQELSLVEMGWKYGYDAGLAEQPAQQEPVAKPYAYEYGRDNGDGTYSVVIEKGDLVQTAPAVYNYVRPRNAHKDWPIKELFDRPQAQPAREPLTDEQIKEIFLRELGDLAVRIPPGWRKVVNAIESAHGITKGGAQ